VKKLPIVNGEEEKTLMPEVLPHPQSSANGSPRERTVRHLRKVMAAAAVAGIAATATRNSSGDAGPDAPVDDAGMDSVFVGHDPGPDAGGPADTGMGADDSVPDANTGFDSMFVGHDPAGNPDAGNGGSSGGCSVGTVGRKGK
jgi:hypothetical protein